MTPRFSSDFSGIPVHTDSAAADFAAREHAGASTAGQHVVFGAGQDSTQIKAQDRNASDGSIAANWDFTHTSILSRTHSKRTERYPGEEEIGAMPGTREKRTALSGALLGGGIGAVVGGGLGFLAGGPVGAAAGAGLGAVAGGVLGHLITGAVSVSDDRYVDGAADSRKNIRFNATTLFRDPAQFALVNWIKGSMLDGTGAPFTVPMYGAAVPANFPSWQVDSVDTDPVYWSTPGSRWNFTKSVTGFWATDSPGPALKTELGAVYNLDFRIGLYRMADLPATTSGNLGSATALDEAPWRYSVKVDPVTGAFSHP
jgi:hypothetical protein